MNIGIVGLGLMGGSLGKAILKFTDHKVYGADTSADAMIKAELVNAISGVLTPENRAEMDIVIFALTPSAARSEMRILCPFFKSGATVIDIAGNKTSIAAEMRLLARKYPQLEFVATHPMAGKEYSGIAHASATMFEHASALFVPVKAEIGTVSKLKELFVSIGFDFIKITTAQEHDRIIAYTSQLAHIVSSCYVNTPTAERHDGFSAGSFRDLSRVARMNPKMWTELLAENKDNVIEELDGLVGRLSEVSEKLKKSDFGGLEKILEQGNAMKEKVDKYSREWRRTNNENSDR